MSSDDIIFGEQINDEFSYGIFKDFKVVIMKKNKYINASKLCERYDKIFDNWLKNINNKIFINEIEYNLKKNGIISPNSELLIDLHTGSNNSFRGIYVHVNLMPDIIKWIVNSRYNQSELIIQQKLNMKFNGKCRVPNEIGFIDILTDDKIIEVKHLDNWMSAFGDILAYSTLYPNHSKCIHLFGTKNNYELLKEIEKIYSEYDVELTYE